MKRLGAVLAAAALLLAGCTQVPDSSSPEVVRSVAVGGDDQPEQAITPAPGVQPHLLVTNFLEANAADAGKHASARTFLTAAARSRWTDTTVTVVASTPAVGEYVPGKPVLASATEIGTVSPDGIYTPTLQTGRASAVQFSFGIAGVRGQYRINSLRSGLILTEAQFIQAFVPRSVYFFDLAHRFLVPDARWTPDTDPIQASETLVNELLQPSPGLQNAVSTDTLPAGIRQIDVTGDDPVRIDISGASQLDATSKNRLAAQIAATLSDIDRGRSLRITDGGTPVRIPSTGTTDFAVGDFGADLVEPPVPEVYYVRGGQLVDEMRRVVSGPLNTARYPLTSVAVSRSAAGGNLSVAGVTTVDGAPRLVMGTQTGGLHRSDVTGVTSRPAFAPGRVEAWVGAGSRVYRTVLSGDRVVSAPVQLPTSVSGQRVVALRLSPEGSRIALVLRDATGHQELDIGAVIRTGAAQVTVGTLQQISPDDVFVSDVAWIEGERLNAIGYATSSQDPHVYHTGADGSQWDVDGIGELPGPPTTIAGAPGAPAWTSAPTSGGSNVYVQASGTVWSNPDGRSATATGTAPTYVE